MNSKKKAERRTPRKRSLRKVVSVVTLLLVVGIVGYYGYLYLVSNYWGQKQQLPVAVDEYVEINIFFSNHEKDPEGLRCEQVYPVSRRISDGAGVAEQSLLQLLDGPTREEEALGYFSNINEGVKIREITIADGKARVDFDARMQEGVGGSCRVQAIRAQVVRTLEQFSPVHSVVICVDGAWEDVLQP